jgi:Tfp pilus assembly protein PilF
MRTNSIVWVGVLLGSAWLAAAVAQSASAGDPPQKAVADASAAIELAPGAELAYYHRGRSWSRQGRSEQAIADFSRAIRLNPKFSAAYNSRANEFFRVGDYEKAIADYNDAAFLDPNPGMVYCNRAGAWLKSGEVEIALDDYGEAIARNPAYAPAFYGRGNAWVVSGEYKSAVADYRRAIELDPKYAEVYDNLAWLLASGPAAEHRNGAEAVKLAAKACELTAWKAAGPVATLAAAHAEAGDFTSAVRWQKRAIELAPEQAPLRTRLAGYQVRKPYHSRPSEGF